MDDKRRDRYDFDSPTLGYPRRVQRSGIGFRLTQEGENLPARRAFHQEEAQERDSSSRADRGQKPGEGVDANPKAYGLYIISVAARLLNMHPQTLRKYERIGLVRPSRTIGFLRLYSEEDIARLRLIKHLVEGLGMNLAGVEFALGMVYRLAGIRRQLEEAAEKDLRLVIEDRIRDLFNLLDLQPPERP